MNDSFYKDIFYRAIIEISTLSFDVDEQLLELKQKDSVTVYVKDRLGQTHSFKIIKKLRNFRFQYEIRIYDEHHHIRVTFFTLPRRCFKDYSESISLGVFLNKSEVMSNAESVIVRKKLNKENIFDWLKRS